jgi:5-methylcytosine-specific restriction endonuclease McrA
MRFQRRSNSASALLAPDVHTDGSIKGVMLYRACRCGARVPQGQRCPKCTKQRQQATDANRGTARERGYNTASWDRIRIQCFERDGWTCIDCGWQPRIVETWARLGTNRLPPTAAILAELRQRYNAKQTHLHCDHIETIAARAELRLTLSNLATRCNRCHDRRTAREHGGFGNTARASE